jgi:hypothetical protein
MELSGIIILVALALVLGLIGQLIGRAPYPYEWVITAIGATVGGLVASDSLGHLSHWGSIWLGFHVFPALLGALLVAGGVRWAMRYTAQPL